MVAGRKANKRPSMFEVAKLAGVSHQTVSRVINNSPDVSTSTRIPPVPHHRSYRRRAELLRPYLRYWRHRIDCALARPVHVRDDGA